MPSASDAFKQGSFTGRASVRGARPPPCPTYPVCPRSMTGSTPDRWEDASDAR
jgi:hypothetical protein